MTDEQLYETFWRACPLIDSYGIERGLRAVRAAIRQEFSELAREALNIREMTLHSHDLILDCKHSQAARIDLEIELIEDRLRGMVQDIEEGGK